MVNEAVGATTETPGQPADHPVDEAHEVEMSAGGIRLFLDPALVEEAVLIRQTRQSAEQEARFRSQRDPLYEISDPRQRERRFRDLHACWFVELGMAAAILKRLREQPTIAPGIRLCSVLRAPSAKKEHADLRGGDSKPVLVVAVRPETLASDQPLRTLLSRELLHVADMLDPEFGCARDLASAYLDPTMVNLVRARYRVLWKTSVDGRLVASGRLGPGFRQARRREFLNSFPMLPAQTTVRSESSAEDFFERFFNGPRPTHSELLAFAIRPADPGRSTGGASQHCSLCRMPTTDLLDRPTQLEAHVRKAIQRDFPEWRPAAAICRQCADLYAA